MSLVTTVVRRAIVAVCVAALAPAQTYSPKVLLKGQPDSSDLQKLTQGILSRARATTPHERAEAIWRFFLTDGRYVSPGFWYHIDGFAYEEPKGEVLDPLKLLNSYGFGLCYHIAAVLEAVYEAAGFEDARVWFLTGHTVAEVYYDGAYHYYDSDMMGYNTVGKSRTVAAVSDIVSDKNVMMSKVGSGSEKTPWYPADVAAGAIPDLVGIFTSANDNWLFPFQRYAQGHAMDFMLRPGERLIRYFGSEEGSFYLPYKRAAEGWSEFAQDVGKFRVRDGPQSRTDLRGWGTGRIEYRPPLWDEKAFDRKENVKPAAGRDGALSAADPRRPASVTINVDSPYVLIDATFSMDLALPAGGEAALETSTDDGLTWETAAQLAGPHQGEWKAGSKVLTSSTHGRMEAVTGKYRYVVRLTINGGPAGEPLAVRNFLLLSRFQFNPRTAPALVKGRNEMIYEPGPQRRRWQIPVRLERIDQAHRNRGIRYQAESEQGILLPEGADGEAIYEISAPDGSALTGFDAGGRFLDLRDGLAPDKQTAETRASRLGESGGLPQRAASLEWSLSPDGPYTQLWSYDPNPGWRDGKPVKQLLRWPEVDRQIRELPPDTRKVFVRYRLAGMGLDDVRLAAIAAPSGKPAGLEIIHVWFENEKEHSHVERVEDPTKERSYAVTVPGKGKFRNYGVILSCPAPQPAP